MLHRLWLLSVLLICSGFSARADSFVLQGSTTFVDRVMAPHHAVIEQQTQQRLTVIPNKTMIGLQTLVEGQANVAMCSASARAVKPHLTREHPDFPADMLRWFEIGRTRMAFAVHPDNPVASIGLASVRDILSGRVRNWREVGGPDLAIRVVMVREGGGVQASVEDQVLGGHRIAAADVIRVQVSAQVVNVVAQEPGALGLAQLNVVRRSAAKELVTDRSVEQQLNLVTYGEPSAAMARVIEAVRRVGIAGGE